MLDKTARLLASSTKTMPRPDQKLTVRDSGKAISYGPSRERDASEWMLALATEGDGRVEIHVDETAMYELWTEVHDVPWPREPTERGVLSRRLVEHAERADADQLRDALEAIGARPEDLDVDPALLEDGDNR